MALGQTSYLDCFKTSHNKIALRTVTGIIVQAYVSNFSLTRITLIFSFSDGSNLPAVGISNFIRSTTNSGFHSQLHFLLRHSVLQECWNPKCLPH